MRSNDIIEDVRDPLFAAEYIIERIVTDEDANLEDIRDDIAEQNLLERLSEAANSIEKYLESPDTPYVSMFMWGDGDFDGAAKLHWSKEEAEVYSKDALFEEIYSCVDVEDRDTAYEFKLELIEAAMMKHLEDNDDMSLMSWEVDRDNIPKELPYEPASTAKMHIEEY